MNGCERSVLFHSADGDLMSQFAEELDLYEDMWRDKSVEEELLEEYNRDKQFFLEKHRKWSDLSCRLRQFKDITYQTIAILDYCESKSHPEMLEEIICVIQQQTASEHAVHDMRDRFASVLKRLNASLKDRQRIDIEDDIWEDIDEACQMFVNTVKAIPLLSKIAAVIDRISLLAQSAGWRKNMDFIINSQSGLLPAALYENIASYTEKFNKISNPKTSMKVAFSKESSII